MTLIPFFRNLKCLHSNTGEESHITHRKDQEKMFTENDALVFPRVNF